MKDIVRFIKESTIDDIDKYYVNLSDIEEGKKYWLGFVEQVDYVEKATPKQFVAKKHKDEVMFVNPDDDRDMFDFHSFINSGDKDKSKNQIAVFKNKKEAKEFCDYYNTISEM